MDFFFSNPQSWLKEKRAIVTLEFIAFSFWFSFFFFAFGVFIYGVLYFSKHGAITKNPI